MVTLYFALINVYSTGPDAVLFDNDVSYTNMISNDCTAMIEWTVSYKMVLTMDCFIVCADQNYWLWVYRHYMQ